MSNTGHAIDGATSLTPYVMRFTLVFVAMSAAALFITTWFQISGNTGLSIGILIASAIAAGQKFIADNNRVLQGSEKLRMAFYSMLVSLIVSLVLLLGFVLVSGDDPRAMLDEALQIMPLWLLAVSLLIGMLLNFAMLYLAYSFVIRKIFEGMVKRGEIN